MPNLGLFPYITEATVEAGSALNLQALFNNGGEEKLHGLFLSNTRNEAVAKLLEKIFNEVLIYKSTQEITH